MTNPPPSLPLARDCLASLPSPPAHCTPPAFPQPYLHLKLRGVHPALPFHPFLRPQSSSREQFGSLTWNLGSPLNALLHQQSSEQFQALSPSVLSRELRKVDYRIKASIHNKGDISESKEGDGFIRKKLAVFVSGGGSNFQTLHKSALDNKIYGDIVAVVSDKPACKACDYAKSNDIPVIQYPKSNHAPAGLSPAELVSVIRQFEVDFVLLAGYLKLLPGELIQAYPRAILNIHPALLPAFGGKGYYGMKVHEAVIRSGARFSGATVHFVDEKYDHGVILAQRVVPVLPYDAPTDLAARVLKEEHSLYPEAVAALCEDRIFWQEDGVPLIRKSWDEAEYY